MTPSRPLLAAALCIAALLAASLGLVSRWTDQPPSSTSLEAPPDPGALPAAAPSLAPTAGAAAGGVEDAAPGRRPGGGVAEAAPSRPSPADRVTRKVVRKAISAAPVQARLARCVDHDGGFGGGAGLGPASRPLPASLLLDLESAHGEIRIVGVSVRSWGGVSEQAVACALDVLRGQVAATSPGEPPGRLQMPFTLSPRSAPRHGVLNASGGRRLDGGETARAP